MTCFNVSPPFQDSTLIERGEYQSKISVQQ